MAGRRSSGTKQPTAKEIAHASGVRTEKVESDMKAVLEAVGGMREAMDERFRAVDDGLVAQARDIRDVRDAMRTLSTDVRTNSSDIKALRAEVRDFRHDFDHREERGRVTALEERVSAIETQLSTASR